MKGLNIFLILMFLILFSTLTTASAQTKNMKKIALTNCVIIDCTGNPPMEDMTLVVTGNRITEIKKGTHYPASGEKNVRVFDLKGAYVLPGLWNMHVHLSDLLPDVHDILATEPPLPAAIRSGRNAMDTLKRGFTGLRIVGERDYADIAWRDAFDSGVFVGPRIYASGKIVTSARSEYASEPGWPVEIFSDGL